MKKICIPTKLLSHIAHLMSMEYTTYYLIFSEIGTEKLLPKEINIKIFKYFIYLDPNRATELPK